MSTLTGKVPIHWEVPIVKKHHILSYAHLYFFRILCLLSVGHTTLKQTYENTDPEKGTWEASRARLHLRLANTTVVVGVFLEFDLI